MDKEIKRITQKHARRVQFDVPLYVMDEDIWKFTMLTPEDRRGGRWRKLGYSSEKHYWSAYKRSRALFGIEVELGKPEYSSDGGE